MSEPSPEIKARIEFCQSVSEENGISVSVWVMDEPDDFNSLHPYKSQKKMFVTSDDFFSDTPGTYSLPIGGPTWLDLWLTAEKLIILSGDNHHIFIEDFICNGDSITLELGS